MLTIETFTKQLCERDLQRIMLNAALERACQVQLTVRETLIMQAQAGHLKTCHGKNHFNWTLEACEGAAVVPLTS